MGWENRLCVLWKVCFSLVLVPFLVVGLGGGGKNGCEKQQRHGGVKRQGDGNWRVEDGNIREYILQFSCLFDVV